MGPGTTARKRQGSTTDNTCFYDICELIYTNALEYKSKETPSMYLHPKDSKWYTFESKLKYYVTVFQNFTDIVKH